MVRKIGFVILIAGLTWGCMHPGEKQGEGSGWYSYMHDQQNTGVSPENLPFPLKLNWEIEFQNAPQPAWPAPAKQDYYHAKRKLEPLVTYDRVFQPVVVGERLFLASSANNSVTGYDVKNGRAVWSFYTGAPNRVAPLWHDNKLFFGSDDGFVYCLDAEKGSLIWKKNYGTKRKMIGNGRIISSSPVRTGIVARGDTLYVAVGLLPEEYVSIQACDAKNGEIIWSKKMKELAPQGYPIIADHLWYIPNSRVQPMAFSLKNGELHQKLKGDGGDNLSLIDGRLVFGIDWKREVKAKSLLEPAITGYKVTGYNNIMYVASDFSLTAIDIHNFSENYARQEELEAGIKKIVAGFKNNELKDISGLDSMRRQLEEVKKHKFLWQKGIGKPYALINTANAVITGQQDLVVAFDLETGAKIWEQKVTGRPYGMAVSGGKLFVSTNKGFLYCFGEEGPGNHIVEELVKKKSGTRKRDIEKTEKIKRLFPRRKGLVLLAGGVTYPLVSDMAYLTDYHIVGAVKSGKDMAKMREALDDEGFYGVRATLFQGAWYEQGFSDYMFNVVIFDNKVDAEEIKAQANNLFRILAPSGGRMLISKKNDRRPADIILGSSPDELKMVPDDNYWVLERKKLPGSGEWTHLYANPSNTVSTADRYASDKVRPLWFGRPGPREMTDRHHRAAAPLFKNGIIYVIADDGVMGVDAYNGTLLWKKYIPNFRRIRIARDAGNVVVGNGYLYVAADNFCYVIDGFTGEERDIISAPQMEHGNQDINREFLRTHKLKPHTFNQIKRYGSEESYWGYLAVVDDLLLGSGRKSSAVYKTYRRFDWGEYSDLVTSDYLFGINNKTEEKVWLYRGGAVLNTSICTGENKIFFVESYNPEVLHDGVGLIPFNTFKKDLKVVALDMHTGKVLWRKPFDFKIIEHVLYGSYSDGLLVMSGSGNVDGTLWYGNYAFDAATGDLVWKNAKMYFREINGTHGEQNHRALIMDGTLYVEPFAYDLKTGKEVHTWKLQRNGHSCGAISGANDMLYFRATNPAVCNAVVTDQGKQLNNTTRPGCWINMIPAGGLLMIPEASSGCTCDFPLQMTIVYQPVKD